MIGATNVGVAAGSAQECVDLVAAAEPAVVAISFDNSTGACKYSTKVYSYKIRNAGQQPAFYLRTDNVTKNPADLDCFTQQDAEYLVARLSFGDQQCVTPATYDPTTTLCVASTSLPYDPAMYMAGRSRQDGEDKFYTLSRNLALESVKYGGCYYGSSPRMNFGGTWYCYDALNLVLTLGTVKNNDCGKTVGAGSAPLTVTEEREFGFLYDWRKTVVYLGLYLKSGTTYVWYDGTAANGLPWAVGRPLGDPANALVYVGSNLTVADDSDSGGRGIICKTAASNNDYDPTARFT